LKKKRKVKNWGRFNCDQFLPAGNGGRKLAPSHQNSNLQTGMPDGAKIPNLGKKSILRIFGIFCFHLVYISPVLVCCTKKNLATLLANQLALLTGYRTYRANYFKKPLCISGN
jgi:hypothetical protein